MHVSQSFSFLKITIAVTDTDLPAGFAVELLLVGCLVEVEVASKELVGALAGDDQLHPDGLDLARHEEHGRARPDRRHVVRLGVVDYIFNCIDAVLMQQLPFYSVSIFLERKKRSFAGFSFRKH